MARVTLRVLLTEGSGLTSRQVAPRLHELGHHVGVLSSDPLALTRFTRSVQGWHRVRPFGRDPFGWLDDALAVLRRHGYDVLFPTQEQVTVLSWSAGAGVLDGVATAVPPFDALRSVQDKISAHSTLERLDIPEPPSAVVTGLDSLEAWDSFPAFVKAPIGTATSGVERVTSSDELRRAIGRLRPSIERDLEPKSWLVQAAVDGELLMVQTVFDRGRMVASHANARVREGARGGASNKRSVREHG
jgi:hypothetical protein